MTVALWSVAGAMALALALVLWGGVHKHHGRAFVLVWTGLVLGTLTLWVAVLLGILAASEGRVG